MTVEELVQRIFHVMQAWTQERRPVGVTGSDDPGVAPVVVCSDGSVWEARFGRVQSPDYVEVEDDGRASDYFEGIAGWIPHVPIPGTRAAAADPLLAWEQRTGGGNGRGELGGPGTDGEGGEF